MQNEGITFEGGSNVVEYTIQTNDKVINITNIGDWDEIHIKHSIDANTLLTNHFWWVKIMCDVTTDPLMENLVSQKPTDRETMLSFRVPLNSPTTVESYIISWLDDIYLEETITNATELHGDSGISYYGKIVTRYNNRYISDSVKRPEVMHNIGRINNIKILVHSPYIQLDKNLGTIKVWGFVGP